MLATSDPRVDVLIPAYNSAGTIASSLRSIQEQTVRDIRIIVIDDGSPDATPEIVGRIAAADPRVMHIRKDVNSGIVDSLNLGLARSRAPYIARHDADDLSYPHRFEVQLDYLDAHQDCIAIGAVARHVNARGEHTGGYTRLSPPELADPGWFPSREPYLMHPFLMVRREAILAVGGYRHLFHSEDTDLYWRLQELGRLYNPPELLGDYRFHAGSITSRSLQNGRVSALNSQLAAISAIRRRSGRPDLVFSAGRLQEYQGTETLAGLLRLVRDDLTADEFAYLEVAVAAKLVECASYRPYVPDMTDCRFIRRVLRANWHRMKPENVLELRRFLVSVGTKMIYHRRMTEVMQLLSLADLTKAMRRVTHISVQVRMGRLKPVPG